MANNKIRNDERERIIELYKAGNSIVGISKQIGRSQGAVSSVVKKYEAGGAPDDTPPSIEELDLPMLEEKDLSVKPEGTTPSIAEKTVHLDIPPPNQIALADASGAPAAPKQPEATSKELAELRESFAKQISGIEFAAFSGFTGKELSKDEKDMLYFCWKMASILIIKDVSKNDSLVWIMLIGAHVVIIMAHYDDLQDAYRRKMRKPQAVGSQASRNTPEAPPSDNKEPKPIVSKPLPIIRN